MTSTLTSTSTPPSRVSDEDVLSVTRSKVRDLLSQSAAFRAQPKEQQTNIARNTVEVLRYLAAPEGIPGPELAARNAVAGSRPGAAALSGEEAGQSGGTNGDEEGKFTAQGAREGAAVAGALLQAVNFPDFVSGLINGVFHSIVASSMKQMEAYGKLVADVAKSLNQFRDENVTDNQGRDHLVDQFPDMFEVSIDSGGEGSPSPRVRLRDGVDESTALQRVNSLPIEGGPLRSLDMEDEETESRLVQAARTQLATSRQQLLATMVLMGINRIIVTDGRISAKVIYDFAAKDNFRFSRSAQRFDYADQARTTEIDRDVGRNLGSERIEEGLDVTERNAGFYTKGLHLRTSEPVLKLISASQQSTDANLATKASLSGQVEVNFKSETFPLEKMADSFQIGMIQNAAKPGDRAARTAAGSTGSGTATNPTAEPPPATK